MKADDEVESLERGAIPAELLANDPLHQIAHFRAPCKALPDHHPKSSARESVRAIMHRQEPPSM